MGDAGAIYTLGDMPDTIISENYIDSIGTPGTDPYHIRGIHVDEGTKHVLGERNVIEIPTDLTCVDCGNWGNKGDNVWNDNYSTSASYTTTGNMEPGTVVTNAHTSAKGIWGLDVFEILANAGPGDEYLAACQSPCITCRMNCFQQNFMLRRSRSWTLKSTSPIFRARFGWHRKVPKSLPRVIR